MTEKINKKEFKKEKIPRVAMPEQDPEKRIRNFNEVTLGYTEEDALREASRCIQCKNPKCIKGCPVEIDIKGFIKLIQEKQFDEALEKIREKNGLPAMCGRVCPQEDQCEKECILSIKDEPVAIGRLERYVADREMRQIAEGIKECAWSEVTKKGQRTKVTESVQGRPALPVAAD